MAENDPGCFVKTTVELAERLGVSRQAVHAWRLRPDAPRQSGGLWNVVQWQQFMRQHGLADLQTIDRTTAAAEIAALLVGKMPARVCRRRLRELSIRVENALRATFNGSRFRRDGSGRGRSQNDV